MSLPSRNLLGEEASPYLRQHAVNPVHWRPWSMAALREAEALDRPILLSIGYAACHWCHVMAHESFEDPATAAVMNRLFVNIKVDREERPDIDQIYMAALSAVGERGGWPLTMFLTPQGQPFWGGTYFPPAPRAGRPGFVQVLETVHAAWRNGRENIDRHAAALVYHIGGQLSRTAEAADLGPVALRKLATEVHLLIDRENGGIGRAPKFPNMPLMQTLWLSWLIDGTAAHRDDVLLSLEAMLAGGIYDHVAGGICRYSTDAEWLVPHFEKMLYDNAQLLRLCNWAFAETSNPLFRIRIEETAAWLLRDMRVAGGAFAASLDADSEGEEGSFYTWSAAELSDVIPEDEWQRFLTLAKPSAWGGDPILCQTLTQQARGAEQADAFLRVKSGLRAAREARIHPARDDKILTDWNGLAIAALAECGRALARSDWIDAAAAAFACIADSAVDGRLPHSALGTRKLFPALSCDYAAMANAAVALFEATSDPAYSSRARDFVRQLDLWHSDADGRGHFLSAADAADVPVRSRGDVDDAIPSATAQIIEAMVRVGLATGDADLQQRAFGVAELAAGRAAQMPRGQAGIVNACAFAAAPRKLVLIDAATSPAFAPIAHRCPDPCRVDIVLPIGSSPVFMNDDGPPPTDLPGAYLCMGTVCLPVIADPLELEERLRRAETASASANS